MTAAPLVILGGGGHARVVIDAARSRPGAWTVVGVVDKGGPTEALAAMGVDHLGDDAAFLRVLETTAPGARPSLVVGVGADPAARRAIVDRYGTVASWATIVHETAWVSPAATLAPGAVVLGGAMVNAGARIGPHAIVNTAAVIEHDADIGAFAHIGPAAALGGGARIGEGTLVGLGARVRDHVAVGTGAVVGMGAVVVASVPDGAVVMGVPARVAATVDG